MTYAELVAALTAAIDQPNPTPPPLMLAGSAGEGDEIPAAQLLERLVAASGKLALATSNHAAALAAEFAIDTAYAAQLSRWAAVRTARFTELDRSVRALETQLQARAPADPVVAAMDPGTPCDPDDPAGTLARVSVAVGAGTRLRVSASITRGVMLAAELYAAPPPDEPSSTERGIARSRTNAADSDRASASAEYSAAMAAANEFVSYLEAI